MNLSVHYVLFTSRKGREREFVSFRIDFQPLCESPFCLNLWVCMAEKSLEMTFSLQITFITFLVLITATIAFPHSREPRHASRGHEDEVMQEDSPGIFAEYYSFGYLNHLSSMESPVFEEAFEETAPMVEIRVEVTLNSTSNHCLGCCNMTGDHEYTGRSKAAAGQSETDELFNVIQKITSLMEVNITDILEREANTTSGRCYNCCSFHFINEIKRLGPTHEEMPKDPHYRNPEFSTDDFNAAFSSEEKMEPYGDQCLGCCAAKQEEAHFMNEMKIRGSGGKENVTEPLGEDFTSLPIRCLGCCLNNVTQIQKSQMDWET